MSESISSSFSRLTNGFFDFPTSLTSPNSFSMSRVGILERSCRSSMAWAMVFCLICCMLWRRSSTESLMRIRARAVSLDWPMRKTRPKAWSSAHRLNHKSTRITREAAVRLTGLNVSQFGEDDVGKPLTSNATTMKRRYHDLLIRLGIFEICQCSGALLVGHFSIVLICVNYCIDSEGKPSKLTLQNSQSLISHIFPNICMLRHRSVTMHDSYSHVKLTSYEIG